MEKDRDRILGELNTMEKQLKMKNQMESKLREDTKNTNVKDTTTLNTKLCTYLPFS